MQTSDQAVSQVCNAVMRGVVASGIVNEANRDRAVDVMRAELKSFLFDDEYADERAVVLSHNGFMDGVVMQSIIASCVLKIRGAQ